MLRPTAWLLALLLAACGDAPPPAATARSSAPPTKVAPPAKPAPPAVTPAPPAGDPACAAATAYLTALHSAAEQPAPAIATLRAAYQNTALQKLVQASDAATARHDDAEVTAALATEGPGAFVAAEYAVHAALAQWMRHNLKRAAEAKDPGERAAAWTAARCVWDHDLRRLALALQTRSAELSTETAREDAAIAAQIDAAFVAGAAAVTASPIDERALGPAYETAEKTWFRVIHRELGAAAAAARDGDVVAAARALGLFTMLRDRLQDRNTPGIALVEAQLRGEPKRIDPAAVLREVDLALVKRARKYCSHALEARLTGTPAGLTSVAEGVAYTRVLLPDMRARLAAKKFDAEAHLATWQAFADAVDHGDDPEELKKLSDDLVHWNCAYQQALGLRECTASADELPAKK